MNGLFPKAFITGVTGQDGSYLVELLLKKGYEVHAIVRRASTFNRSRIEHVYSSGEEYKRLKLYYADLADAGQIVNLLQQIRPDEVYHLGAQSHVRVSFDIPEYTGDISGLGTTRILEALRHTRSDCKFYQASSSEMYGDSPPPQSESTPFRPRSPYACAKLYSYWMVSVYREGYGMWCCNGILFNHESPRRGPTFVTRKIAAGVASILAKKQKVMILGNLDAKRDWGYAPEYVEMMVKMLQQSSPANYVIGTGESHSVREFIEAAFSYVGVNAERYIKIDEQYKRPAEVQDLIADSRKAESDLGWKPKLKFQDLVKLLVDSEMKAINIEPIGEGFEAVERLFPNHWWQDDNHISFAKHEELY